jgi:DNA repair protein RadC
VDFEARKVIKTGLLSNAAACILAHNHPSGKAEPTREDIETTRELKELCEKMGLTLLDHVIVGDEVASMKAETGLW